MDAVCKEATLEGQTREVNVGCGRGNCTGFTNLGAALPTGVDVVHDLAVPPARLLTMYSTKCW